MLTEPWILKTHLIHRQQGHFSLLYQGPGCKHVPSWEVEVAAGCYNLPQAGQKIAILRQLLWAEVDQIELSWEHTLNTFTLCASRRFGDASLGP